ncbi:MAG: beta-galactosidase, partial [Saprospiraceae bacterium]|nr:beta-galactosidase [Saprospiraceae bacterium]
HFQRIPRAYWRDRLLKAKALGLNTVATYVFWNALEPKPGRWDFSGNNDLAAFIETAREVGLYVFLRPGPYACAEWDFGGLPAWLLAKPGAKVRCFDLDYMRAAERYVRKLAAVVAPHQIGNGGNVLLLQIENEYGSYGNDWGYLSRLRDWWQEAGITLPFCTADGATPYMLEAGSLEGCAVGLDPGHNAEHFAQAKRSRPEVPAFCSEYYPGWLTHWGENWQRVDTVELLRDLEWLIQHKKSWNLYVLHGGTNWGFYAGANFSTVYQPDVTSYDYDAPVREDGTLTPKYWAIRRLLERLRPPMAPDFPAPPTPLPAIEIAEFTMLPACSFYDLAPEPIQSPQPRPMEQFGQNYGFILYSTYLRGHHQGKLTLTDLHDYANVYLDGQYIGSLDRTEQKQTLDLPKTDPPARRLDILVEGMGRINYGQHLLDPKGITERVTLNGMTLMDWLVHPLPMDSAMVATVPDLMESAWSKQPGLFFRGSFQLNETGDTYLDLSGWEKGLVWVNGHALGRYWKKGPQQRLYLPAPFLKNGTNEVLLFDLHRTTAGTLRGAFGLE